MPNAYLSTLSWSVPVPTKQSPTLWYLPQEAYNHRYGYNPAMQTWLAANPWIGMALWIILYTSDYYLTIYSARGFREIGHFRFEGSFELTPQYQKDIDNLRPVSRLHLTLLVAYSAVILLVWWLTHLSVYLAWTYPFYLGMFLLLEVAVHLRHLRNVILIRELRRNGSGLEGQLTYRKWFSYRISAQELYIFASLFLLVALLTYSLFFTGGALMCYATGFRHARLARKTKLTTPAAVPGGDVA